MIQTQGPVCGLMKAQNFDLEQTMTTVPVLGLPHTSRTGRWLGLIMLSVLSACSLEPAMRNTLGVAGVGILAKTPTSSLEQVYYLGVFDPQDQLPPTMYRVRVRGQASALNFTRYASGWVRAELIDSLSTVVKFDSKDSGSGISVTPAGSDTQALLTGRRLIMFGPEGFREAPKDHRLVVVMGSSPEKFFGAIDEALGTVAAATQGHGGVDLERGLFREVLRLRTERERLEDIRTELKANTGVAP